jgi:hypothetical protein
MPAQQSEAYLTDRATVQSIIVAITAINGADCRSGMGGGTFGAQRRAVIRRRDNEYRNSRCAQTKCEGYAKRPVRANEAGSV